ncbi:MAG TPA: branched-chain amino acid ABC transporter permease [Reyranella sp.]|nr:branched-chain amino acid ABC transporter permease [Reyranella sp.]
MSILAFIVLYGVSYGLVLCLIAVGLVVTMGLMRVVNLAHGAFAAIGGYVAIDLTMHAHVPFPLAVCVAVAAVAAFSVLVERAFFVSLYRAPELDQVLLTVGLSFLAIGALSLWYGRNVYPVILPSYLQGSIDLGFRDFEVYRVVVVVVCAAVITGLWLGFERTNLGARLRAAVDNRSMAQATGINVPRLFSLTFALGSGLAALGGALGAPMLPLEPYYPFKYLVIVLIIVALSGHGSLRGAIAVSIMIGVMETAVRLLLPELGAFLIYIVLIVLIVWRREGLFAARSAS